MTDRHTVRSAHPVSDEMRATVLATQPTSSGATT